MRPAWEHDVKKYQRNKEPGVLIGVKSIRKYMQIGPKTFYTLYQDHGLPAMRLPDAHNRWCTTKNLIDEWVVKRWKAQKAAEAGAQKETEAQSEAGAYSETGASESKQYSNEGYPTRPPICDAESPLFMGVF